MPLTDDERREAIALLRGLPRGGALLHGDLHPGNVLMSSTGPVVIDWFDAAVGHPVADVVRASVLIRPFDGPVVKPHLPGATTGVLRRLHDAYVDAMSTELDRPHAELHVWESVVAASRLAEGAEADEAPLLALWAGRNDRWCSPLAAVVSGDQRPDRVGDGRRGREGEPVIGL
ncbi:MAG: phosphotransferase [Acidimicrobiales bacterium]